MAKTSNLKKLHYSLNRSAEWIEHPEAMNFDPVWFADKIASVDSPEINIQEVIDIFNESLYLLICQQEELKK